MTFLESKTKRGLAISGIVLIIGAIVLLSLGTSSVMSVSFVIDGDNVTTDNGTVDGVTVSASGQLTYDGAENPPEQTDVELQVRDTDANSWDTVATESTSLNGLAGSYSYAFTDENVLTNSDWTKSDFEASGDGETKQTQLEFRVHVTTNGNLDGDDNRENENFSSNTATTTIDVTNEANNNQVGGSGSVNVSGTDNDPSDNIQGT